MAPPLVLDDYFMLKDLKLKIERRDDATFSLCFWVYLVNSGITFPAILIQQMHTGIEGSVPFLILNKDRKIILFPLLAPFPGNSASQSDIVCTSAETECPSKKWVHIGCDVSSNSIRLHINGMLVGEKLLSSSLKEKSNLNNSMEIILVGNGDSERLQGYIHHVQILPKELSVKDNFIKNPPMELSIDSSCLSEIEEGGDGVWSIVGGKASCRRNFTLDVVLLDALGHPVNMEMEELCSLLQLLRITVVATLIYADNGAPVEKPNDAEASLLTSYDGIEFASFLRPSKLLHGRASFKLKISQLSSKCDNRLFCVWFGSPKNSRYSFLEAYSNPIRCISRSRNTRTPFLMSKKPSYAANLLDGFQSLKVDNRSPEAQQRNGEGHLPIIIARESKSSPPPKRVKAGIEKSFVSCQPDPTIDHSHDIYNSHALNTNQGGSAFAAILEVKSENNEGSDNTPSDSENVQARDHALYEMTSTRYPIADSTIFKYCLGGTNERFLLLKPQGGHNLCYQPGNDGLCVPSFFVHGLCPSPMPRHGFGRYQISIAKRLLLDGTDAWDLISQGNSEVLWQDTVAEIEEQFMRISRCSTRALTEQDIELLHRIAECQEVMTRENFDKLWYWMYPVAYTLSRDWTKSIWESMAPRWIEGLITKEEAVFSLGTPRGLHEPGTFILRFPTSRSWPHPDDGSLVVTYISADNILRHRILFLDYSNREINHTPLEDLLLAEPKLTRLASVTREASKLV